MFFDPLTGWREVILRESQTTRDWVLCLQQVVDEHFSEAEVVRIVQDNLNTHNPAAFYEILEPAEAKRLLNEIQSELRADIK